MTGTTTAPPNGKLMTGAIGSIFFAIAWAIFITMTAALLSFVFGGGGNPGDSDIVGGLGLLAFAMILAGGIMQGLGFLGLNKMYGGTHSLAGLFTILISVGLILLILAGVAKMLGLLEIGGYVLFFSMILGAFFGGLGFLGARGKATSGGGALAFGGITLVLGAGAYLVLIVLGLLEIVPSVTLLKILAYVAVIGMLLGHVGAAAVMFSQRK